jgi:hypothetical protein
MSRREDREFVLWSPVAAKRALGAIQKGADI